MYHHWDLCLYYGQERNRCLTWVVQTASKHGRCFSQEIKIVIAVLSLKLLVGHSWHSTTFSLVEVNLHSSNNGNIKKGYLCSGDWPSWSDEPVSGVTAAIIPMTWKVPYPSNVQILWPTLSTVYWTNSVIKLGISVPCDWAALCSYRWTSR